MCLLFYLQKEFSGQGKEGLYQIQVENWSLKHLEPRASASQCFGVIHWGELQSEIGGTQNTMCLKQYRVNRQQCVFAMPGNNVAFIYSIFHIYYLI